MSTYRLNYKRKFIIMRDINPKEDDWKIIAVAIIVPILIGIAIYCIENNLLAQPLP